MAAHSASKSNLLFDAIQESQGFYHIPVLSGFRSRVNITFRVCNGNGPSTDLEAKFAKEAEKEKIIHVTGHRSVGGMRASLYNAVNIEDTKALVDFMIRFMKNNQIEP